MTSYLFLIPPSEGKTRWWIDWRSVCSFVFNLPETIAKWATEKDLKCTENRYQEWIKLNKSLFFGNNIEALPAIDRYSWVMYSAIDYEGMSENWKQVFEENFLILSGMYGALKPLDSIGNYKLPIETKWLYEFWWDQIVDMINDLDSDYVVNLLPISYSKLVYGKNKTQAKIYNKKRKFTIINVNFLKSDGSKFTHWVKKIRWDFIKNVCEQGIEDYKKFGWVIVQQDNDIIDINITID